MRQFSFGSGALLATVAVLATPAMLLAAGDEHAGSKDPLTPDVVNMITTVVVFGLLLVILRIFAWKPILEGLHKREQNIRGALEAAQQAKAQAERVEQEFRRKMAENDEKVRQMFEDSHKLAQELKDKFLAEAKAEAQQDRQRLLREIETAKDQALQDLWRKSVELATLMSSKAVRRTLTQDDHSRLVDEALAELQERQQATLAGGRA
jgi:F-type H+-transporting ATPase subunit b